VFLSYETVPEELLCFIDPAQFRHEQETQPLPRVRVAGGNAFSQNCLGLVEASLLLEQDGQMSTGGRHARSQPVTEYLLGFGSPARSFQQPGQRRGGIRVAVG
jgi:hypothetical protein